MPFAQGKRIRNYWYSNEILKNMYNLLINPMLADGLLWVLTHYNDVIMSSMASQITSLTIVYSTVYSDADQRKHQSSASLAFVQGIHQSPVNSPHKGPVTRKMFPFDDVIMHSMELVPQSLRCRL